jgi:hypothetical protein
VLYQGSDIDKRRTLIKAPFGEQTAAMRYPDFIEKPFDFPPFFHVHMEYPRQQIQDLGAEFALRLDEAIPSAGICRGQTVAVGVGSRGIDRLPELVRMVCGRLTAMGARPVIIPAMGSHGGATAPGQKAVLASLGVTESACSAPIRSSMETVRIGTALEEVPVYYSKDALGLDHSIFINRVKPHTKFKAPIESGLLKMLCVGMGKHDSALSYHRWALKHGFYETQAAMGQVVMEKSNFRFAVGVVENAYDKLMTVEVVRANRIFEREPGLLALAKEHLPKLPVRDLDVLAIRRIGKEISGAGMDPNVTGRAYDLMESDFSETLSVTRVTVLGLSKKSDGNAIGLGNSDFITEALFQELDYEKTVMNALTSTSLHKAFIPIRMPTEEKAIQACFTTLGPKTPEAVRAIILEDSLNVANFMASSALRPELENIAHARLGDDLQLAFDIQGRLVK